MRIEQILARLAEINAALDEANGEEFTALETEARSLMDELKTLQGEAQARQQLRDLIAEGAGNPVQGVIPAPKASEEERAAKEFVKTKRMVIGMGTDNAQARAVLISSGKLATPTEVEGIHDIAGAKVSSIIDMVRIVNCEGMGANRVAYVVTDADEADTQTEGSAAAEKDPTFGYIDIKPTSVAVTAQISKQAKKQTPLQYSAKVREQSLLALRKKAATIVTDALVKSTLNASVDATLTGGKGVIGADTLRKLALSHGGDEGIGAGVLFLNKKDLLAFGDVRGTNEKKAVYEITPNTANPNIGIIKDGGLSVNYCINSNLTACTGTAQGSAAKVTMVYGDPLALELDLFSDYEISVSEDFAFTSLMDTIRGDVEMGSDVVVPKGFTALTIAKTTA